MGDCVSKNSKQQNSQNNITSQKYKKPIVKQSHHQNHNIGIYKNLTNQKSLLFNHSSLRSSEFLFNKFKNSDGSPQEVNLGFMIKQCKINIQNKSIDISYITTKNTNIWYVYGGIEKISQTGLTIELKNYKQIKEVLITGSMTENVKSNNTNANPISNEIDRINNQDKKSQQLQHNRTLTINIYEKPCQNILIIFQPLLQNGQTIFMIYRYQIVPNEKQYSLITQTLQWCSLAFRINDIYGADSLFQCDSENELCSVCLTARSDCILLPCRHMCICEICLTQIEKIKPKCPLCRKQYYSVVKYKNTK